MLIDVSNAPTVTLSGKRYKYYLYKDIFGSYYYYVFPTRLARYVKNPSSLSRHSDFIVVVDGWIIKRNIIFLERIDESFLSFLEDLKRDFVIRIVQEM